MPSNMYTSQELEIIVQYAIKKYDDEQTVINKLGTILAEKQIQQCIDTLIGTQRVRRIGPDVLQNNESHTELPDLPEHLRPVVDSL